MSSIPYNYGSYIDAKVSMTDTGHVSAGKQIQSPASAGSRGLAKTTQFTNDRTQMQMGNSPIAESMIEIRSILNRIDGVNVPVQEEATIKPYISMYKGKDGKQIYDVLDKHEKSAYKTSDERLAQDFFKKNYDKLREDSGELSRLKELSGIEEDDESYGYEWECSNCGTENEFVMTPQERAQYIKDWEADNQDLVANGETGENALNNLLDDTGEESGMHYGQKCMKCGTEAANPYQPMPEGDEFDIEEDEDFEEVLGPLGFPEDETELFDAEYQGRKVPLNKPMRGDTKKFKVYVKDPKTGNVKKVNFGHGGTSAKRKTMRIRKSNPKARKSFRARHNCANPGPKTKARYWSCRKW